MKARITALCAFALALVALAAGCGGDDDDGTDLTTSSLSRAAWTKKVNQICQEHSDKMMSELISYGKAHKDEPAAKVAETAVQVSIPPTLNEQVEEVQALGAPSGDEAKVEKYLASLQRGIRTVENSKPTDLFALQEALAVANDSAVAYGLEECKY